nr:transglycosylase SLT domain-containing protein [uncultured Holophaga sp.]
MNADLWLGLGQDLGRALLHSLWQVAVVALVLKSWLLLLPGRKPRLRYALACLALLGALAWPAMTFGGLRQVRAQAVAVRQGAFRAPTALSRQPLRDYTLHRGLEATQPVLPWLAGAWALGALVFALRMFLGLAALVRLRRVSGPAPAWVLDRVRDLARRMGVAVPRVGLSDLGPCVFGALRPTLLLSAACLAGLPAESLEAILAHELAHLKRLDYPVQLLQSLVDVLLFHHPLAHWISSAVRFERERCCDEFASKVCGDVRSVAKALMQLDGLRPLRVALAAGASPMFNRIQSLLGLARSPQPLVRLGALLCLGAVLATLPLLKAEGSRKYFRAPARLVALADQEAKTQGLDPYLIRAVIQCESAYKTKAVSSMGSQGLMQLLPRTAERMGGGDMFDPATNVKAGTRYLKELMDYYKGNVALAVMAYNAGPEAVDAAEGIAPAEETRRYGLAVLDLYRRRAVEPDPALD